MNTAEIEARAILEAIYIKNKSPSAVLIDFINNKNNEIAEYKEKYEQQKRANKHEVTYRKNLEKAAVKRARAEAREEFANIIISDFPEMEFYIKGLIEQIRKAERNNAKN